MTMKRAGVLVALLAGAATLVPAVSSAHDRGPGRDGMDRPGMMAPMPDFDEVDANGDGKITREEIAAHRAAAIAGLDADGDGFISKDEMTAFATARATERATQMVERHFAERDVDGDGKISAAEMMAPPARPDMFERLDADGDGAISKEEADAARERMMERGKEGRGRMGAHHGRGDRDGHGPRHPFFPWGQGDN
ncbi:Ca2+-binding EF-hand superfamily protein [Albidovulum inexpectatum]|uniref:Ca2+-binding EF-hand superfamily protein n=1 Tax=Albidovulum inexpectatum TaxID=196587 RepID=A0A2S5JFE4_9RHOB|nr:EF-hand domain-containing protein [Albidovulum inexpectatum]PPB80212.1 Ca2+-binding EF-hand superfamily protein [Albidovulum inexpectatum]